MNEALRRWLLLLLLGALCPPLSAHAAEMRAVAVVPPDRPDDPPVVLYRTSHALIIGASRYTRGWPSLPGVRGDVAAVRGALERQGFEVTTVEDPSATDLRDAFRDFIRAHGHRPDARLLIYFAGHGHTLELAYGGQMGYIVPVDAPNPNVDREGFLDTALDMQQIEVYAKRIQSRHAMFMFDSCFSGSIFHMTRAVPEHIAYKTGRPVRQFITAGQADEPVPDQSVFRRQFCAALEGEGDTDGDGYLTGAELGEFLQKQVTNYSRGTQHPQYGKIRDPNLDKGDFVFVLGAAAITPAPTPTPHATVEVPRFDELTHMQNELRQREELLAAAREAFATAEAIDSSTLATPEQKQSAWQTYLDKFTPSDHRVDEARARLEHWRNWSPPDSAGHDYTATLPGGVALQLVWIDGGRFVMGTPPEEQNEYQSQVRRLGYSPRLSREGPQRTVQIDGFWIGRYEVTQEQWTAVAGDNPSRYRGPRNPVESVSWDQANAFCRRLSELTGDSFQLPTEAQWEYACRAGTTSPFSCGDGRGLDQYAHYDQDRGGPVPVGSKRPNPWGLYDMHGNVWEYCTDWWSETAYRNAPTRNPTGPSSGRYRVIRGGAWDYPAFGVRSGYRDHYNPRYPRNGIRGLRVVRIPDTTVSAAPGTGVESSAKGILATLNAILDTQDPPQQIGEGDRGEELRKKVIRRLNNPRRAE